jgi:lipopolysaccharide transport system ATP-binding protein
MSRDTVIRAEGLGKKYVIGHAAERERYTALRDVLVRNASNVWRTTLDMAWGRPIVSGDTTEEFWALKELDFEIKRGEVVGIIGRNGAGKTTLLKILSRITEPTAGRVTIGGRVASLLEVGTGFHPELTGRENIYLNGAILGMSRAEIRRKFDEIVAFAEVERFLDTPVKRYSSGMYVRLAFAVAAHLEPEILIVDEVLAVGDADFQKKCLGKMSEVAGGGRTVLFVSHSVSAIETLCPKSMYLASGSLVSIGDTPNILQMYLEDRAKKSRWNGASAIRFQNGLQLERVQCSPDRIFSGSPLDIEIAFRADQPGAILQCAVLIYSAKGIRVAVVDIRESGTVPFRYTVGQLSISVRIETAALVEGTYVVGLYVVTDHIGDELLELAEFSVTTEKSFEYVPYPAENRGYLALRAISKVSSDWRISGDHMSSSAAETE